MKIKRLKILEIFRLERLSKDLSCKMCIVELQYTFLF